MSLFISTISPRIGRRLPPPRPLTKPPGSTYKRCHCRDPRTGKWRDTACPLLRWSNHGSWYFYLALPPIAGKRRRIRRGGFETEHEAREAMQDMLDEAGLAISATGGRPSAITALREYLATVVSTTQTPGTRWRVRQRVRPWVRPLDLMRLSSNLRWKDRP
jgi:hypothetical protein